MMRARPELLSMPNIPKPLHGLNPRTIMGKEAWDLKRQEVYASTNYHCACCGVHKSQAKHKQWLEAHEIFEIDYKNGTATLIEIVPLCNFCHSFIHSGLLRVLARKKTIKASHVQAVMQHGVDVMRLGSGAIFAGTAELADLVKVDRSGIPVQPLSRSMAGWRKWRMIWDGVEHKGKYKSFEAWRRAYA